MTYRLNKAIHGQIMSHQILDRCLRLDFVSAEGSGRRVLSLENQSNPKSDNTAAAKTFTILFMLPDAHLRALEGDPVGVQDSTLHMQVKRQTVSSQFLMICSARASFLAGTSLRIQLHSGGHTLGFA